jgi:hypothetical protein
VGGPAGVTPEHHGEILTVFERQGSPIDIGETLALPDGTTVQVIRVDDEVVPNEYWKQTVHVGNLP